jgi:hypothetical protein
MIFVIGAQKDQAANSTSAFLGAPSAWKDVHLVVQQASPLFGGREFYVSGSGTVVIVLVRRGSEIGTIERRFQLSNLLKETSGLFAKMQQGDLLNPDLQESQQPGPTCHNPLLFVVRNGAGEVRSVPTPAGAAKGIFDEVLGDLYALVKLTQEKEPLYEADYNPAFIPKDFVWSTPIVGPRKIVQWVPFATAEERARAEEEYQRKVQLQLDDIARQQVKEEEGKEDD